MNRRALVVGINRYPYPIDASGRVRHLRTAAQDAAAIAHRLSSQGGFQEIICLPGLLAQPTVEPTHVNSLHGQVTQAQLWAALQDLFLPPADRPTATALFFFAGHGMRVGQGEAAVMSLITSDVFYDPQQPAQQRGLSIKVLRELLRQSPVQQQLIWLDCCHSGELLNFDEEEFRSFSQSRDRGFIAASQSYQSAYEDTQREHSLLTQALLDGLTPTSEQRIITSLELTDFVRKRMQSAPQTPDLYNFGHEIVLTGLEIQDVLFKQLDCPYKGLAAFEPSDAHNFFGRQQLIETLCNKLREPKTTILAVLGPSGSGKSSVVKAGLIPRFLQERERTDWQYKIMRPGAEPLTNLAQTLAVEMEQLRDRGLATLIPEQFPTGLLLIVDQFEEIFTLAEAAKRPPFLQCLLAVNDRADLPLKIVLTMRADFFGKCLEADMGELTRIMRSPTQFEAVAALRPDQEADAAGLRDAIRLPAVKLGVEVQPELVERILEDVQGPGSLPLLQYALTSLWEVKGMNRLTLRDYEKIGGVKGALQKRADEFFNEDLRDRDLQKLASEAEQAAAQRMFLELTQLGEGTEDTRRQVKKADLLQLPFAPGVVETTLNKLVNARLLVTSEQKMNGQAVEVVDIAHETLIRHWPRLRIWLNQNRDNLRLQRRIEQDAKDWLANRKSGDYLLKGSKLAQARDFQRQRLKTVSFSPNARKFLERSQLGGILRRLRFVVIGSSITMGALIFASLVSWQADEGFKHLLRARALTAQSLKQTPQTTQGLILAMHTFERSESRPWMPEEVKALAKETLQTILQGSREQRLFGVYDNTLDPVAFEEESAISAVAVSPNGQNVLSGLADGTLVLREADGREIRRWRGHSSIVNSVAFSPDSQMIVSGSNDRTVRLWDLDGNAIGEPFEGHEGYVMSVAFSRDEQTIASASADGTVRLWNLEGNAIGAPFEEHTDWVRSVAFSPDGETIVSGSDDGTVRLWNLEGEELATFYGHTNWVQSVAFSPDGQMIVSGSNDRSLRLWNAVPQDEDEQDSQNNRNLLATFSGHTDWVRSVAFNSNGTIVSGSDDGTVRLWDLEGNELSVLAQHSGYVESVTSTPDSKMIVSGSNDGTVKLLKSHYGFEGQQNWLLSMALSPDGQKIAVGDQQGTIRLWDVDGKLLATFEGHEGYVRSVAFSPDGKMIVSGSTDGTLRLWDLDGNAIGDPFKGHTDWVQSVAFSPDGQMIVSGSDDRTVRLWDLAGNAIGEPFEGHTDWVQSVAFSPDGQMIVSGSDDGTVRLWDLDGNAIGEPFEGHTDWVQSVAFSSDGQMIVSGSNDRTVRFWDLEGNAIGEPVEGHDGYVQSVTFSSDGQTVVSSDANGIIQVVDLQVVDLQVVDLDSTTVRHVLHGHKGSLVSAMFMPNTQQVISGGVDGTIRFWNLLEGNAIGAPFEGHAGYVYSVAFSPDGQMIVSGSDDGTLRLWDLAGNAIGEPFEGHAGYVYSVAFSPDGQMIVSGSDDGTVRLWDLDGNAIGEPFEGHAGYVYSVAFSPDGQMIISGSDDRTVRLWDLDGNAIGKPFEGHTDWVRSVAFSPDGQMIVSGSDDGTVRLWDLDGSAIGEPLEGHTDYVQSVAFSPDGQMIVSGSNDRTVRLWDLDGNAIGEPFAGHTDWVQSVAFSPDGQMIISGSDDGTVRLWDLDGNAIGEPFAGHAGYVYSVVFSPDGQMIVSGSDDGTVRLWSANGMGLFGLACNRLDGHPIWQNARDFGLVDFVSIVNETYQLCNDRVWSQNPEEE